MVDELSECARAADGTRQSTAQAGFPVPRPPANASLKVSKWDIGIGICDVFVINSSVQSLLPGKYNTVERGRDSYIGDAS